MEVICNSFANHESIYIKENNRNNLTAGNNHLPNASARNVEQLLRNTVKKSEDIDKIPPKLKKLSSKILSKPLVTAVNGSFNKGIFLDNPKIVCVSPLDKHTDDKYSVSNFLPVSVSFSKICEKIVKGLLISKMEHHCSLFISAYRKPFSTEHIFIRPLENWSLKLDNNSVAGTVLTVF